MSQGMSEQSPPKDLYAVLGAEPSDSPQQLKDRYKQLALKHHPDRLRGLCASAAEASLKRFLEAEQAWRILGNQEARSQYDLHRKDIDLQQAWPVDSMISQDDMIFNPGVWPVDGITVGMASTGACLPHSLEPELAPRLQGK
uniref:J domain-containing protein n=1 Tax=Gadus morhua TaxID=8049 RepID=A0ABA3JSF2_GADMO